MQAAMRASRQLARACKPVARDQQARTMSSGHSVEESVAEMSKWRNITYLAVPGSVIFAAWTLLNEEGHHEHEKITYPYMHVRSKTFPWGDCGLFEHCEEEGDGEE